jgi:phospholipid/cholesterol/gamma-HCH transport system ATP-binding protein
MPTAPAPTHIPHEDHLFVEDVKKSFGATKVIKGITMHLRRRIRR